MHGVFNHVFLQKLGHFNFKNYFENEKKILQLKKKLL